MIELEGGRSALKLTTATYWRPSGKNIHRLPTAKEEDAWGVTPNDGFTVPLSDDQYIQVISARRERDAGREFTADKTDPPDEENSATEAGPAQDWLYGDPQLQKAIDYLTRSAVREDAA